MRAKFLITIAGFVLLISCSGQALETVVKNYAENNMTEKNNFTEITLGGKAQIENEKLVIDYILRNNSNHTIYVFDEMIAYEGYTSLIDRKTAYCFFEEPDTLRIVRATLHIPKGMRVYALEIPYAREIKAQSEAKGSITLDIPVNEKSPFYAPPTEKNSKMVKIEKIRLILGWTKFREGTEITETDVSGEKVLRIRGNWKQYLVEGYFKQPLEVRVYTDSFDRQMPQN